MSGGFRDSESTSKRRGGRYEKVSFRGGCSFPISLYRRHAISITIMPTQTGTAPAFLCGPKCIHLHLFPYSGLIVSNFRPCLEPGLRVPGILNRPQSVEASQRSFEAVDGAIDEGVSFWGGCSPIRPHLYGMRCYYASYGHQPVLGGRSRFHLLICLYSQLHPLALALS